MTDLETADALHLAGDIDAAADAYRRLIAADQDNVAAWHGLGVARLRAGAYGAANDALLCAVCLRLGEVGAWGFLAEALFELGERRAGDRCLSPRSSGRSMRPVAEENVAIIITGSARNASKLCGRSYADIDAALGQAPTHVRYGDAGDAVRGRPPPARPPRFVDWLLAELKRART